MNNTTPDANDVGKYGVISQIVYFYDYSLDFGMVLFRLDFGIVQFRLDFGMVLFRQSGMFFISFNRIYDSLWVYNEMYPLIKLCPFRLRFEKKPLQYKIILSS